MKKTWTEEEEEKAILLLKNGNHYNDIKNILNRSYKSVKEKLNKLGYVLEDFRRDCYYEFKNCIQCDLSFESRKTEKRKFCSQNCAGKYNMEHKTKGTRRSKLEIWLEEEMKNKYNFEIIFNGKETINSELDIYIPSLKLAFELNGIFHYEPIYGSDKLNNIQNNDNRKFQACLERGIELCIIDTSKEKQFKKEKSIKYLNIINDIIKNKIEV